MYLLVKDTALGVIFIKCMFSFRCTLPMVPKKVFPLTESGKSETSDSDKVAVVESGNSLRRIPIGTCESLDSRSGEEVADKVVR